MNNTINLINLKENDVESIDTARKDKTLYIYLTLKKWKKFAHLVEPIRKILSNGNGYTNFQRERNRIFYYFNNQWVADPLLENIKIKRKGKPRGKYKKTR